MQYTFMNMHTLTHMALTQTKLNEHCWPRYKQQGPIHPPEKQSKTCTEHKTAVLR